MESSVLHTLDDRLAVGVASDLDPIDLQETGHVNEYALEPRRATLDRRERLVGAPALLTANPMRDDGNGSVGRGLHRHEDLALLERTLGPPFTLHALHSL